MQAANEKYNKIPAANPALKAGLVKYCTRNKLPLPDSNTPLGERYKMRNRILIENPKLKEEYIKSQNRV